MQLYDIIESKKGKVTQAASVISKVVQLSAFQTNAQQYMLVSGKLEQFVLDKMCMSVERRAGKTLVHKEISVFEVSATNVDRRNQRSWQRQ